MKILFLVSSMQGGGAERVAALLGELASNPGFQRAGLPPITKPKAVMLLAGVRELAAQTAEDDLDIESVIGPATDIAISILAAR